MGYGGKGIPLNELKEKTSRTVIGLMSGTSADGVNLALTEISGTGEDAEIKLKHFKTFTYFKELREKIFQSFSLEKSSTRLICELNFLLGRYYAKCINRFMDDYEVPEVDLIGSHGQTVWHAPVKEGFHGLNRSSTLQIGEPAIIAMDTGIPVVADFRKADIAAGGQGAPLTPYLDYVLHRCDSSNRVLQNIGGIANLTYLPEGSTQETVVAFDTGPGNMIIDSVMNHQTNGMKKLDRYGETASQGEVNQELLEILLAHPYYAKKPPKTTGREDFGEQYAAIILEKAKEMQMDPVDVVSTVTELTAYTISRSYGFLGPVDEVYLSGGGSMNTYLVSRLRESLGGVKLMDYGVLGLPAEAKEAVLMALLANEHIMDTPSNIPAATGANQRVRLGVLYSPQSYDRPASLLSH